MGKVCKLGSAAPFRLPFTLSKLQTLFTATSQTIASIYDSSACSRPQTHMVLNFRGSQHFRQRLVCSTLSGKSICIRDIRAKDQDPGVRDYEASLLRLLEKITNGCVVEINETGT